jgi:L-ascorbate metabolism protein UlaG (beta-lactamase superfamily)
MRVRWLGWAGVEIETDGAVVVIDALRDAGAMLAPFGDQARDVPRPEIAAPGVEHGASAGLLTHLHRDHADADALARALRPGAPVLGPASGGEEGLDELGLAQAAHELDRMDLTVTAMQPWEERSLGPFRITALPAVDGSGDPQLSWVVEADGQRVIHLGDTMFHGYWWRFAHRFESFDVAFVPVNGAAVDFPHRQPASGLPAAMTPEEAAAASAALQARIAVPIHFGGYDFEPFYRPIPDAHRRFVGAATARSIDARALAVGEMLDLTVPREGGR